MGLQTDIAWITAELKNAGDPQLVKVMKDVLTLLTHDEVTELDPQLKKILNARADRSEEDIKAGRYSTTEDMRSRLMAHFRL